MITRIGPRAGEADGSPAVLGWAVGGVGWLNGNLFLCSIASLAAVAPRGSRFGARLLRRHSGTKSVSRRFSSARRRAIRCLTAPLAALALSYGSLRADHTSESDIVLLLSARERRVAPSTAAMQASTATSAIPRSNHGATRMAGVRALRKGISTTMLCAVNS